MKLYIAGKITGLNRVYVEEKFAASAEIIKAMGHTPINPVDEVPKEASYNEAMKICIQLLLSGEGIFLQPDWRKSQGAIIENRIAVVTGLLRYHEYIVKKTFAGMKKRSNTATLKNVEILSRILYHISSSFGIDEEKILSNKRIQEVSDARHLLCKVSRNFGLSFPNIGAYLNRNHSTIMHSIEQAENLIYSDPEFKIKYETILDKIGEGALNAA